MFTNRNLGSNVHCAVTLARAYQQSVNGNLNIMPIAERTLHNTYKDLSYNDFTYNSNIHVYFYVLLNVK